MGVIKAGHAVSDTVRPFPLQQDFSATQVHESGDAEQTCCEAAAGIAQLREMIVMRDEQIAGHEKAIKDAFDRGKAAGWSEAEETFDHDRETSLAKLSEGIDAARTQLDVALASVEGLALTLAVEIVDKLFGDPSVYHDLLARAINARLRGIEESTILSVTVSRLDFPDTGEVAHLPVARDKLVLSEELEAGECRIDLELGGVEFSCLRQWADLKGHLADRDPLKVSQ